MDSDDSEPVGKTNTRSPAKKRKKQKGKAIELKLRKRRKENQRAEEQTKQEQTLSFIGRLSAPGLRRWLAAAHHVLRDTALADIDAEFQQLAVNAGCAPSRIFPRHPADQVSTLPGFRGASRLSPSNLPSPKQAMPSHNRLRLDDD